MSTEKKTKKKKKEGNYGSQQQQPQQQQQQTTYSAQNIRFCVCMCTKMSALLLLHECANSFRLLSSFASHFIMCIFYNMLMRFLKPLKRRNYPNFLFSIFALAVSFSVAHSSHAKAANNATSLTVTNFLLFIYLFFSCAFVVAGDDSVSHSYMLSWNFTKKRNNPKN